MLEGRYGDARAELEQVHVIAERIGDPNARLFHRLGMFHLEYEDQAASDGCPLSASSRPRPRRPATPTEARWPACLPGEEITTSPAPAAAAR